MRSLLYVGLGIAVVAVAAGPLRAGGNQAELKKILDRAIKAEGGLEKVAKLRAMSWKGKADFEVAGQQISLKHEVSAQGWDQYRLDLDLQVNGNPQTLIVVQNGNKIWRSVGGNVQDISKDRDIGLVRGFFYAIRLPQMLPEVARDKMVKLSHLGELKVGDHDTVGLSISRKGRPDLNVFFDKKSGLPVKSSVRLTVPGGQEKEFEFRFSQYKDFDGLKHFTKITIRVDEQDYVTELSAIQAPGELDASLFDQP
jgi:hypothetical protein